MQSQNKKTHNSQASGFTLLDSLVGVALFALVGLIIFQSYFSLQKLVIANSVKVTAAAIIAEQIETIRNIPYASVGLQTGIPAGILLQDTQLQRNGKNFSVHLIIRNIDDPSDGTIGGSPNDLSPADYKLVQLSVTCTSCPNQPLLTTTTTVAPKGLETTSGNGALFVRVFDAAGQPVAAANVHIENTTLTPTISFDDVTTEDGWLRLVDVPPAQESYQVRVTKSGYSSDQTYPPDDPANPNPLRPHTTVVADSVTQVSFAIDQVSTLTIQSLNDRCASIGNVDLQLTGSKILGSDPDVLKYDEILSTNVLGQLVMNNQEWDTYALTLTDAQLNLAGMLPTSPLELPPGASETVSLIVAPKTASALLVEVLDATSQQPIAAADVQVAVSNYNRTITTGEGHWQQTDWSGGSGQADFMNEQMYYESSGSLDLGNPAGDIKLAEINGDYVSDGWLTSSSFDRGTTTNYYHLVVHPQDQPVLAGDNPVQIQIASNNDNATWNFIGPDGTAGTFYTPSDRTLHEAHTNQRYIRYRAQLHTDNPSVTPNVSDIAISFASECSPSGQAYFRDVKTGTATISVSKTGYQAYAQQMAISLGWQKITVLLMPEQP